MEFDLALMATAAVAFTAAGIVKGVVGLGLPLTAIAVLTIPMGLREAVPLIIVPVLITNAWQMTRGGLLVPLFKRFWTMILPLGIGAWMGTVLLFVIDETLVGALLGVVIIVYSLVNLFALRFRIPAGHEAWYSPGVGLLSGLLTGLTGSVGGPVAIYFQALGLDRETFLRAVSLSFFLTALPWGGTPDRRGRAHRGGGGDRGHRAAAVLRRHVDRAAGRRQALARGIFQGRVRLPAPGRRQSDQAGDPVRARRE